MDSVLTTSLLLFVTTRLCSNKAQSKDFWNIPAVSRGQVLHQHQHPHTSPHPCRPVSASLVWWQRELMYRLSAYHLHSWPLHQAPGDWFIKAQNLADKADSQSWVALKKIDIYTWKYLLVGWHDCWIRSEALISLFGEWKYFLQH